MTLNNVDVDTIHDTLLYMLESIQKDVRYYQARADDSAIDLDEFKYHCARLDGFHTALKTFEVMCGVSIFDVTRKI